MASIWWYLGFARLSSVVTTSDTNPLLLVPSLLIECNLNLRLGAWASNYTPVDRSGLHNSLSSYALSVILRVSFWFWDCINCCAVPSSWAGTLKPLVVWSNQDTVTWNHCDANVFVGCGHPLGRNSVGHTALSPLDQKNLQRNWCGYCVISAQITTYTHLWAKSCPLHQPLLGWCCQTTLCPVLVCVPNLPGCLWIAGQGSSKTELLQRSLVYSQAI